MLNVIEVCLISSLGFVLLGVSNGRQGDVSTPQLNCSVIRSQTNVAVYEILFLFNPKNREGYSSIEDFDNRYCKPFNPWVKEAMKLKQCLKRFSRTIAHMILTNLRKPYQLLCKDRETKEKSFDHSKCLTPETSSEFVTLRNKVNNVLKYALNVSDIDDIISATCCGFHQMLKHAKSDMNSTCNGRKIGLPETPDFIVSLVESTFSDVLDMTCAKFSSLKDCWTLAPNITQDIKNIASQEKQEEADYSPILPMIDIIDRLDGQVTL